MNDLADRIEALTGRRTKETIEVCAELSAIEGCKVTLDADGDFRFWKWGKEFFCLTPKQVCYSLRAKAATQ